MLHQLKIENFFSIADQQVLRFEVAANVPTTAALVDSRAEPDIRLPTAIGFFGANASGKTTVLKAMVAAQRFALNSFRWQNTEIAAIFQPYRHHERWDKPTRLTIEFDAQLQADQSQSLFRYELDIAHDAKDPTRKKVAYEALSYRPHGKFRRLFERQGQEFVFGGDFDIDAQKDPRKDSVRDNASVLSTFAALNHAPSMHLCWLIGELGTNFSDRYDVLSYYLREPACLQRLNTELQRLDLGLESMVVEQGAQGLFAKFKHVGLSDFIYLGEESQGTQRFIELFPLLYYVLDKGGIAVIDELDIHFHPLILPEVLRWFNDVTQRNKHKAQLLFTAHNSTLLDELEKEQVFLVQKPLGQASQVYRASDIAGLRRAPSLMKKYLAGELGAVPHIG